MPRIFISYRRADSEAVTGRIHDRLVREFGFENVFLDVETGKIPAGEDFRSVLQNAVGQCDVLLAIIGPKWLDIRENDTPELRRLDNDDDFVRIEILTGLEREKSDGALIIPVLVGGAQMPSSKELPDALREIAFRNAQIIRPNPDFHKDMTLLVDRLNEYFNILTQSTRPAPRPALSSMRGRLVLGLTILLVVIAIVAIILSRQSSQLSPAEIANQRLTQTALVMVANLNTQAAEATISNIMTQIANNANDTATANETVTASAYTHTPTLTQTPSNTPTEDFTMTARAQATRDAQLTAQVPTNTSLPTEKPTSTPTPTASVTPKPVPTATSTQDVAATQTEQALQITAVYLDAAATQSAQSTQTTSLTQYAEVIVSVNLVHLRQGPGVDFGSQRDARQGDTFQVIHYYDRDGVRWYQLNMASETWISSEVVYFRSNDQTISASTAYHFAPPTDVVTSNTPVIIRISMSGTCDNYTYVVRWSDPNGDANRIEWTDSKGVIQTEPLSGSGGLFTSSINYTCTPGNELGVCLRRAAIVDNAGNRSNIVRPIINCS